MMDQFKKRPFFLVIAVIIFLGLAIFFQFNKNDKNTSGSLNLLSKEVRVNLTSSPKIPVAVEAKVIIDSGKGKKVEGKVMATTAYEALIQLAKNNNIDVETKPSQIGIFVSKIGDKENSKDTFWLYQVNGKPSSVGADQYVLTSQDRVEWKYTKM